MNAAADAPPGSRYVLVPDRPLRFLAEETPGDDEWHGLEENIDGCHFRWTGPQTRASRELPIRVDRKIRLLVKAVHEIQPGLIAATRLSVNGHALADATLQHCAGGQEWVAIIDPEDWPAHDTDGLRVCFDVPATHSAQALGLGDDTRRMGIAIGWMQVEPV
jgi:hypothetical protein